MAVKQPPPPANEIFDSRAYQRPQQTWICGHHADGQPCPLGPTGRGECMVHKICTPWHDGTAWHCTRARAWGGRCREGPIPDPRCPDQHAACPHLPVPCQPVRSLRSRRRRLSGLAAAAALGCCLLVFGGSSGHSRSTLFDSAAIVSPGRLSAQHATLDQACGACHSAASEAPLELLSAAVAGHHGLEESSSCLACHLEFGEHALLPHSANPVQLARETEQLARKTTSAHTPWQSLARRFITHSTTAAGELACATCHHEHRGADFDLTAMTNAQCQSCHAATFHSFADGHPDFSEPQRASLYFDHLRHLGNHFPKHQNEAADGSGSTTCSNCHVQDAAGTAMILQRFEFTCANCHSRQIADDHRPMPLRMPGSVFFTLNLAEIQRFLPEAAADGPVAKQDLLPSSLNGWPQPSGALQIPGNRCEPLPPFMEVLLLADPDAATALETLRAGRRVDSDVAASTLAAARRIYALGIKRLLYELVTQGEDAITNRLQRAVPAERGRREQADAVARTLADSGFLTSLQSAQRLWFPDLQQELQRETDEPTGEIPDKVTVTGDAVPGREWAPPAGPWTISEDGLTLVYRCRGHADPVLRVLLSFAAAAAAQYPDTPAPDAKGAFDRLFRRLAAPEATGHCMKCHTVDAVPAGPLRVNWSSRQGLPTRRGFTTFAHGPHVTLLSHAEESQARGGSSDHRCETCHALQDQQPALRKTEFLLADWMPNPDNTAPSAIGLDSVRREGCVKCHTSKLAGDNCLQCHNYHVPPASLEGR